MPTKLIRSASKTPLVRLSNATFFREQPDSESSAPSPALFPGTNLNIFKSDAVVEYWAVVGPAGSGKTTFLQALCGQLLCEPSHARTYPYLAEHGLSKYADPRQARNRQVNKAIRYTGFGGKGSKFGGLDTRGSYMAARYESRHEAEDFSLKDYLTGNTEFNAAEVQLSATQKMIDRRRLNIVSKALQLDTLLDQPAFVLSNGQTRRARIAKSFMEYPLLLLLDEPFLGIDPIQLRIMTPGIWHLSRRSGPNVMLALSNDEVPPRWITHLMCLDNCKIQFSGPKNEVYDKALAAGYPLATDRIKRTLWRGRDGYEVEEPEQDVRELASKQETSDGALAKDATSTASTTAEDKPTEDYEQTLDDHQDGSSTDIGVNKHKAHHAEIWHNSSDNSMDLIQKLEIGEPIIEMKGVQVEYGKLTAVGNWHQEGFEEPGLHWTIRRGERWGIFGPNGSGKTTLLSLVNSDHPKSYSQSISYFGRSRLPEPGQPGISIFDLQSKIMQASPEVHAFFPKRLSVRETIENAWADTFLSKPRLTAAADYTVEAVLRWFEKELNPACGDEDPLATLLGSSTTSVRNTKAHIALYHERSLDWADKTRLSEMSFAAQRVALFLRAMIKKPDLIILDEAFSGMDKDTRTKCMMFLTYGETKYLDTNKLEKFERRYKVDTPLVRIGAIQVGPFESRQALVVVAHDRDEVPPIVDQYLFLEEPGTQKPPRFGSIPRPTTRPHPEKRHWWDAIWTPSIAATNKNRFMRTYSLKRYGESAKNVKASKRATSKHPQE